MHSSFGVDFSKHFMFENIFLSINNIFCYWYTPILGVHFEAERKNRLNNYFNKNMEWWDSNIEFIVGDNSKLPSA